MNDRSYEFIGHGVYTLSEAQHLTSIPYRSIARWTRGYSFKYRGTNRYSPPVIAMDQKTLDGHLILNFLDLIEVRFLNAFRQHGVSWNAIRISAQRAKELLQVTHPFSTKNFKTDGRSILADFVAETGDRVLLDLVKNQYEFKKVISPYLYGGLEFGRSHEPVRWYPLEKNKSVVIDPSRGFGAPILNRYGISTRIIYQTYLGSDSYLITANWYDVDETSVRNAVSYEKSLIN
jgi:uncharacterized protein (DUF433 family)